MNWFKFISGFAILLISGSISYYLMIYIPAKDNRIYYDNIDREDRLSKCLYYAELDKINSWDTKCELLGRGKNCLLLVSDVDEMNSSEKLAKDYCFKQFK